MSEIVLGVLSLGGSGLVVMATYSLTWRQRPRVRHALFWPLVLGYMFWGYPLPGWLRATRHSRRNFR